MLIEKMENLKDTIKVVTESVERTYAQYAAHFPREMQEIAELRMALYAEHDDGHDDLPEDLDDIPPDFTTTQPENLSDCRELEVIETTEEEEIQAEVKARSRRVEKEYRILAKRCLALTHPDKCMRFGTELRLKLREAFHEARRLFDTYSPEELQALYVRICFLRNELDRIPPQLLQSVQREIQYLEQELSNLSQHPVFIVMVEHKSNRLVSAKNLFKQFLLQEIGELRSQLA